jgi:hypothetical protein
MIIIRHAAATSSLPFFPPPPPPSPPTLPLSSTEICAKPQSRAHTRNPHQRREPQCADTPSPKGIGKQLPKESSHTVAAAPFSSCAATESPHLLQHREQRSALPQSRPLDIRIDGPGWAWLCLDQTLSLLAVTRSSATGDIRWLEVGFMCRVKPKGKDFQGITLFKTCFNA